ncbi:MAG: magnesium-dependent phosphatase-1 [Planctomycetota bacterium]
MQTPLPKLVVFDLDFTLWDCGGTWCDCLTPPFRISSQRVTDCVGHEVRLYPDVLDILDWCDQRTIPMAIASRTEQPDWARELLELLELNGRFVKSEIYPTTKLMHFAALRDGLDVEYEEMLFFDDEPRNIREVGALGVQCILVPNGLNRTILSDAIEARG